ncbi:hypothetical protein HDU87_000218 [Geranomyces variabilis]|uniref:Uncharacterized protein n=1 Tax=Geranomyces variabilis TaxID=109894 RepID=A0AAD5TRW0_9FUNG|nr:hypothetical protein HDU87_000218 [Geranomyces variabilis]
MVFLEKQILDHVGYFIASTKHQLSPEEKKCVDFYDNSPIYYGLANFAIWGSMAYFTLDFRSFFPNHQQRQQQQQQQQQEQQQQQQQQQQQKPRPPRTPPPASPVSQPAPRDPFAIQHPPAPIRNAANPRHPAFPAPARAASAAKKLPLPRAVRPVMPAWITLWGIAAISAGAFASTYYTSKWAARECLQCFIDVEDKKSELYKTTRRLLKEHNPDADKYFKIEKHFASAGGTGKDAPK